MTSTTQSWSVGEVEIHAVTELEAGKLIQGLLPDARPAVVAAIPWLQPEFCDASGRLRAIVRAFVLRSSGRTIVVDPGIGNGRTRPGIPEWTDLNTAFLGNLERSGVEIESVDLVVCTHLHIDHIGWNTRRSGGEWVATFPSARYLFVGAEYEYVKTLTPADGPAYAAVADSIVPIADAGLVDLVESDHRVEEGIRFLPTPGHSPAHVSIEIESGGARALISGDVLHHPCQIAHPEWRCDADFDAERARSTRRRLLDDLADTDTLLIGSHFSGPEAGRIVRSGESFELAAP
jgi:glyoxylase-like metal-dependent hydrolase (beta-lactamase superfamily II)